MIQIIGLREEGHAFFNNKWGAPSVRELLANPEKFMKDIPEDARWNLFFTAHDCVGKEPRDWNHQEIIPVDIDGIDPKKKEQTARFVCEVIGVDYQKTASIFSGNGIWLFIQLENKIERANYFLEQRELYKLICQRVNQQLKDNGFHDERFKPHMDPSVFSARRLCRLPNTWNKKPNKMDSWAHVIQGHMEEQGFDIVTACGAPRLQPQDAVHEAAWKKFPVPDSVHVQKECGFLVWAKEKQEEVTEDQWHALCGTVGFLPEGDKLIHEYSEKHPKYSFAETAYKVQRATTMTGPRTCNSISQKWDGCKSCPYFGKLKTPLQIVSEDYVATETTGFYKRYYDKTGNERTEPAYEDLIRYFKKSEGPFFSATSGVFYNYKRDKFYWETVEPNALDSFAYEKMENPKPRSHIFREFRATISVNKVRSPNWMTESTKKKLNLKNGVYDLEIGELAPHSEKFGFMSILPYEFDPHAKAPKFEQFLKDVTMDRADIAQLLVEFMGYCLSGDECWIHKAMLLIGEGSNGKSTFNKVLKALVGPGYYSSLNMSALQNDQKRSLLEGKLFNLGDENSPDGMLDSDMFKSLVAGEEYDVKLVYKQPHTIRNRAKMIFNCNSMPKSKDNSEGLFRRLLFVPFDAKFTDGDPKTDPRIEHKLFQELPGILNLCIKGYRDLVLRGGFQDVSASQEILTEYKNELNNVDRWFDNHIKYAAAPALLTLDQLYDSYYQFCEREHNKYPDSRIEFARKVQKIKKPEGMDYKRARLVGDKTRVLFCATLRTGF